MTREEFEHDILHERFLEHQEVRGHYFGTSVSAVKKIIESGRVPVLDLQPQVRGREGGREGGLVMIVQ